MYLCPKLDDTALDAIRQLESEIDTPLVAMREVPTPPAELDGEALSRVEALEQKLGVVLVAVKPV